MKVPPGLIDSAALVRAGRGTDHISRSFREGRLVRIRRGFYVGIEDWNRALPLRRFAWTAAAISRSIPHAVLCGESAILASGLDVLGTPACVELATSFPGRSGLRRSPFMVLGDGPAVQEARRNRSYPLRYRLQPPRVEAPVQRGEFQCEGLLPAVVDVMATEPLSKALVVADGAARIFRADGFIPMCGSLADVPGLQGLVAAQSSASAQARANRVAALASPLAESVGESFSRAVFETLGFDQPNLQQNFQDRQGFVGRSDFWWPGANLVGEFDGKQKYIEAARLARISTEEAVYREKLREDRIRALGHGFVRWGWADLVAPDRLRSKLMAAGLRPSVARSRVA